MFVSCKFAQVADDTPVHIALVMEDSATTRSSAYQRDLSCGSRYGPGRPKSRNKIQVGLEPRVLISTNDNARPISVEKEDFGARWCFLKEIVFYSKIVERVRRLRRIDLDFVERVRY